MSVYYEDDTVTLHHGDCIDVMRTLPDASVDAIVCDPPYGLGFMGKAWDDLPPGLPWALECLRVLKPGGHLLAFGGTRTWHRLAVAVEDAGFEVRDSIAWLYGSGFPKSLDVSKAIDKTRDERHVDALSITGPIFEAMKAKGLTRRDLNRAAGLGDNDGGSAANWTTTVASRALKPRVPTVDQWTSISRLLDLGHLDAEVWRLNGNKAKPGEGWTSREVVGQYDAPDPRLQGWAELQGHPRGTAKEKRGAATTPAAQQWSGWGTALKPAFEPIVVGRKPLAGTVAANVLAHGTGALNIDDCRVDGAPDLRGRDAPGNLPNGNGHTHGAMTRTAYTVPAGRWPANVLLDGDNAAALDEQTGVTTSRIGKPRAATAGDGWRMTATGTEYDDAGGASRFFPTFRYQAKAPASERPNVDGIAHPTVKPLALMRWLVRLVTPPGGLVLEPFAGSGATVEACLLEGFQCVAIEQEADYLPLTVARLLRHMVAEDGTPAVVEQLDLFGDEVA